MQKVEDLLNTGVYETFNPSKKTTIGELLKDLKLEDKYFGILVDGKKAGKKTYVDKNSEIVILPHIAGGAKSSTLVDETDGIRYAERTIL